MTEMRGGSDQATRDAYAQAWGLFRYLLQRRPQQLARYMSALAAAGRWDQGSPSLGGRFVEAFGPIALLEADYHRFIGQLSCGQTR
jgi:plasmid stabilization system protein ParE